MPETAIVLFKSLIERTKHDEEKFAAIIDDLIMMCQNYEESTTAEFIKNQLLPLAKEIDIKTVQDGFDKWHQELDNYLQQMNADE